MGGGLCSLLPLPNVTLFLVIHYHSMTNFFFLLSFYDVAQAQDHSWSGADPPWCWKFLGFWVSWVRPMGFSTPGYFAFTEMCGFEESSVGTYFPRKPPYSAISCCLEIGQGPFPIQNQTQFKQLGKVCWGRGLPMQSPPIKSSKYKCIPLILT